MTATKAPAKKAAAKKPTRADARKAPASKKAPANKAPATKKTKKAGGGRSGPRCRYCKSNNDVQVIELVKNPSWSAKMCADCRAEVGV